MKPIAVLYENEEILVVYKDAGLAVQGGAGITSSLDRLLAAQAGYQVFLVHRLDRDTAGILLVAKTPAAAAKYAAILNEGKTVKEYTAFCFGAPETDSGHITDPVARRGQEKTASTFFSVERTVLAECGGESADGVPFEKKLRISRVRFTLGTGRMHQIRIHAAQNGFPIVADDKYGDFALNRFAKRSLKVSKLQLAALKLVFPCCGEVREICAELPGHMKQFSDKVFSQMPLS